MRIHTGISIKRIYSFNKFYLTGNEESYISDTLKHPNSNPNSNIRDTIINTNNNKVKLKTNNNDCEAVCNEIDCCNNNKDSNEYNADTIYPKGLHHKYQMLILVY